MDIITALAPVAPAAADDYAVSGAATPFDTVLQQVRSTVNASSVPAEMAPTPSVEVVDNPAPVVREQALLAQPDLPEVASEPLPAEPEPESAPQPMPPAEAPEAPTLDGDVAAPALVTLEADAQGQADDLAVEDDTEQGSDALEAIRQRLELIDTAGLMAAGALVVTPPVAWAQPPATSQGPEPDVEGGAGDSLEAAIEAYLPVDNSREAAVATDMQPEAGDSLKADGQFSLTTGWNLSLQPNAPGLVVAGTGSDATPPVIASVVGSDEWQSDLGQHLLALARRGDRQVDLQLHPADLGPLSISLNISDGGVQAQFHSAHAAVRVAVEQALPQLQSALASQGLNLGEASVNDGASRQAMGEQPRRESPGGEARAQRTVQVEKPPQVQQVATTGAGVDLYL